MKEERCVEEMSNTKKRTDMERVLLARLEC